MPTVGESDAKSTKIDVKHLSQGDFQTKGKGRNKRFTYATHTYTGMI